MIVIKPSTYNIEDYINAEAFIFALKDFSSFNDKEFDINFIKEVRKNPNIKIYVLIDKNIFNDEIEQLQEQLILLDKINIDGVIFYDLAVLKIVRSLKLNIPLIINQNFMINNYETCNYYYNLGVKGVILPAEITKEEILEIKNNTKMELFINIFGYQMIAFSKRKLITNYFKYIKEENKKDKNYMKKEGKAYHIIENKTGSFILSPHILNGIKYLDSFKDFNIILNEIDLDHKKFIKVINIFRSVLDKKMDVNDALKKLEKLYKTDLGFFDTKTIYKVK